VCESSFLQLRAASPAVARNLQAPGHPGPAGRDLKRRPRRRAGFAGVGLIDALVGMTILAVGLLGVTRFQTRMLSQVNETQSRLTAVRFGNELLNTILVDSANAACYTLPQAGACGSATARTLSNDWKARALAALPGTPTATSAIDAAGNRLTVTLTWTGKASTDAHRLQVTTDVRQ
jgi:type IV pilus assembly protein PilV